MVIILVASTFLVQNQYYATQIMRTGAQDNVRAATELLAMEIRSVMEDGIVTAGANTLTIRSPLQVASVCFALPNTWYVYSTGGQAALDTAAVAGVAKRDTLSGSWTYLVRSWSALNGSDVGAQQRCFNGGADTVGKYNDFHEIAGLGPIGGATEGDLLMLFSETTFTIAQSGMDSTTLGLFRREVGGSPVEFATGLDTTAKFQYRTAAGTYVDTVLAAGLSSIDVVRLVADARKPAPTGGQDDVTFGWSVNVALRNVR